MLRRWLQTAARHLQQCEGASVWGERTERCATVFRSVSTAVEQSPQDGAGAILSHHQVIRARRILTSRRKLEQKQSRHAPYAILYLAVPRACEDVELV